MYFSQNVCDIARILDPHNSFFPSDLFRIIISYLDDLILIYMYLKNHKEMANWVMYPRNLLPNSLIGFQKTKFYPGLTKENKIIDNLALAHYFSPGIKYGISYSHTTRKQVLHVPITIFMQIKVLKCCLTKPKNHKCQGRGKKRKRWFLWFYHSSFIKQPHYIFIQ